ncbi:MAG: hypothetical protein AMXMBFR84_25970 [Candidatus Hydrogenedentota bacterium]
MPVAVPTGTGLKKLMRALARASANAGTKILRDLYDEGEVTEDVPASLSVTVGGFLGFVNNQIVEVKQSQVVGPVTPPTGGSAGDYRRIDLVVYTLGTGFAIIEGDEGSVPEQPDTPANSMLFATLHLRNNMATIEDADNSTDGYIVDARTFG